MPLTLADLRSPQAASAIRARLATNLAAAGAPVSDWAPSDAGGVENTRLDMVSGAMAELLADRIANIVNGRFLGLASGDWLAALAAKFYKTKKRDSTFTIQNVRLTLDRNGSAKTFRPGDVRVMSPTTGNRYISITGGTLIPGDPHGLDVQFQAAAPGKTYADVAGTITKMVTAPAGVDCTNRRPADFAPTKTTGPSSGSVSAKYTVTDTPPDYGSVRVRIDAFGNVGGGAFSYSVDGGSTWIPSGPIPATFVVPGGATLTFANAGNPSFIQGTIFTLLVADAILQRGTDAESDDSLRARCRARWTTLSDVPLGGTVGLWARLASPEVARVLVDADPNTPGGILVTVASESGPASPAAVIACQDFIGARLRGYKRVRAAAGFTSPEETVQVASAMPVAIRTRGTVNVQRDQLATVQVAANNAWLAYLRDVPLGGETGAIVRAAVLEKILMDTGADDAQNVSLINGAHVEQDQVLGVGQVAVPGFALQDDLVWTPI